MEEKHRKTTGINTDAPLRVGVGISTTHENLRILSVPNGKDARAPV
jgi:hypothetical protein